MQALAFVAVLVENVKPEPVRQKEVSTMVH
jgi:hypothetical protein